MSDRHDVRSWKTFLPSAYSWLKSLNVVASSTIEAGSWLALPVKYDKGINLSKTCLPSDFADLIVAKSSKLGWQGKSPVTLEVEGTNVLLVPVNKLPVSGLRKAREAGIEVGKSLKGLSIDTLSFCTDEDLPISSIIEGFWDSLYEIGLFKHKPDKKGFVKKIELMGDFNATELAKKRDLILSTMFTRMLQDAPANWLTPDRWAEIAVEYFSDKDVEVSVLGKEELKERKMGSFLSVAAGSPLDPKLISIKIKGRTSSKNITLVGKGLTFDAGGISLKPSSGMGEMKYDMSGGAAVMGAAHYLADQAPDHDVHCIIGAVENMPSGSATRPGDIVQSMSGKTIEVLNTDAEGRLVLADLLTYAASENPDMIVDLATLTGAVLHGLGHTGAAIMSNSETAVNLLKAVGEKVGEPLWELPLWPELSKEVKSDVADLKNMAKPNVMAGTIIGGIFLSEFVPKEIPWVHMDIAGTAWSCNAVGYSKSGGCGFGVRSITELCSMDL